MRKDRTAIIMKTLKLRLLLLIFIAAPNYSNGFQQRSILKNSRINLYNEHCFRQNKNSAAQCKLINNISCSKSKKLVPLGVRMTEKDDNNTETKEPLPGKDDINTETKEPLLSRIGNGIKTAGKVFLVSATVLSIVLACDSIYKLTQQPITLQTIGPALGNLLPLAAFGYVGAVRIVSAIVRFVRILLSVPIVLGGTYYLAPQLPNFFQNSPDVATTSLFALLATPEVLEVLIVLSVLVTFLVWVGSGIVGLIRSLSPNTIDKEK